MHLQLMQEPNVEEHAVSLEWAFSCWNHLCRLPWQPLIEPGPQCYEGSSIPNQTAHVRLIEHP